jgi:hypothetical protein
MKSEMSVEIDRPIEQVFELTNRNVSKWSITVVEDEVIEDRNDGDVGTKFRIVTEERGKRMEFAGEVTEHRPPHSTRSKMVGPYFDIDALYLFEDLRNGRTRVTQKSTVTGKGFFKVMLFLMSGFIKKSSCDAGQKELDSLKAFVEAHD